MLIQEHFLLVFLIQIVNFADLISKKELVIMVISQNVQWEAASRLVFGTNAPSKIVQAPPRGASPGGWA